MGTNCLNLGFGEKMGIRNRHRYSHERSEAMRAAILTGYGDVDKLEIREVPEPEPGPTPPPVPVPWRDKQVVFSAP